MTIFFFYEYSVDRTEGQEKEEVLGCQSEMEAGGNGLQGGQQEKVEGVGILLIMTVLLLQTSVCRSLYLRSQRGQLF
jgi:hypothetical protein